MATWLACWSAAGLLSGCADSTTIELRREAERLREAVAAKDNELAAKQSAIEQLNQQLMVARALKPEDLKKIYYPETLVIDPLTGGEDYDGKPGDDGVTVYLKPVDRDGDTLKVAGDIRIELFDLAKPGTNLISRCYVPVEQAAQMWYGKFMTYHYTVRCPWQQGPPQHTEITVRATFVDYLTQRVLTAQAVCKVRPPPAAASQPR